MANGQGTATINFGASPGLNETTIAIADAAVSATSKGEAFFVADDATADHTASDHRWIDQFLELTCGAFSAGVGFTVYGTATELLEGTFKFRYVWSD